MTATATRPAYRAPWTHGAKAYPEADSLDAMWNGIKRKRKALTVHVSHDAVGDLPCACCGRPLGGEYPLNPGEPKMVIDRLGYAYCDVNPRTKVARLCHYYCAWGMTLSQVIRLGRAIYGG